MMKLLVSALVVSFTSGFGVPPPTASLSSLSTTRLYADKPKVFIDGEAGTTGLQVRDRLAERDDIEIISIANDLRKDENERKRLINEADVVILCLPDAASIQAASWVEPDNDRTVLIDASTAYRVDDDWVYGFPGMFRRMSTNQRKCALVSSALVSLVRRIVVRPFASCRPTSQNCPRNSVNPCKKPNESPIQDATPLVSFP